MTGPASVISLMRSPMDIKTSLPCSSVAKIALRIFSSMILQCPFKAERNHCFRIHWPNASNPTKEFEPVLDVSWFVFKVVHVEYGIHNLAAIHLDHDFRVSVPCASIMAWAEPI